MLNGIYWRLRTGSPWADIPERYGPPTTCANRFRRWAKIGVWDRIFEAVSAAYDGDLQMIDSSSIRVHQHGGNVKKGVRTRRRRRSGRRSTPVHGALARRADDQDPRPRRRQRPADRLKLTEGQAHDGRSAADMLGGLGAGQILLADRAYDSDALRQTMTARGAWANIKPMARRVDKPAFSPFLYRYRNLVERFFNKLKHFRAVATRYEKHAANYLALVKLAATRIWMRVYESVT